MHSEWINEGKGKSEKETVCLVSLEENKHFKGKIVFSSIYMCKTAVQLMPSNVT